MGKRYADSQYGDILGYSYRSVFPSIGKKPTWVCSSNVLPSDGIDQITWHFTCTSKIKICYGIYINDDINLHVTYKFVYTCIYIIYEFKLKG